MPIHLPPISRRRFLKGSLTAAAAALAVGPGCVSSAAKRSEQDIAFLSDIHIAADPTKLGRGINMTDHFKAATGEILALPKLPDTVFINGDLAFNSGEKEDYASVLGLIQPMREAGLPIHVNMGNHDDREHLWGVLKDLRSVPPHLPGRQASIVRTGPANWFMLDSLIKTLTTPGKLGDTQLVWLADMLDANPNKPALIMIHHQPGALSPTHPGDGLQDAAKLLDIIRPRRQVKAYFFGHTHRWSVAQDPSGIHLINFPPTAYVFDQGQPNGWVHGTIKENGARLELRCLDHAHPNHGQIADLKWREA